MLVSCATYVKECIRKIDAELGDSNSLYQHRTPLPQESHPQVESSALLDTTEILKYQALIGMAQWACVIGRVDIGFAVSSLSRFSAAPRQGHASGAGVSSFWLPEAASQSKDCFGFSPSLDRR